MAYPLCHQEPTGVRIKMPGNNNGDLKVGLDRRQIASSRLSCISEHQKENTPNSEDEYIPPSPQAMKTPSLDPIRQPFSHRHIEGKSHSSGDGPAISPLQLDSEQVDGFWRQRARHQLILSTWGCVVPGDHEEKPQHDEPPYAKFSSQAPSEALGVPWQTLRCNEARRKTVYTKEYRRTILGTGFDGPRSSTSGTSSLDSPSNASRPPAEALALASCMPRKPRRSQSDSLDSIDWEKNWPKRKPRRGHDVSESSARGQSAHERLVDAPTMKGEDKIKTESLKQDEKHQPRSPNVQDPILKSSPEFNRQSPSSITPASSRYSPDKVPGLESPDYSQFDSSRHPHRHHFHNTVLKRFRSLRDKLYRRRSTSMFSVRPEFPPPPDGKERRYRSRNSNDIWPSSGEESPIFNTPASKMSPVQLTGHNANLLAATGLMMATADIDRLTGSAYEGNRPRMIGTKSLELPRPRPLSDTDSLSNESRSSISDSTPVVPANSPASLPPPVGPTNTLSRSAQWPGGRKQPSRLSEVTTLDKINNHTQPGNGDAITPHDACKGSKAEHQEGPLPLPLPDSRLTSSDDKPSSEGSLTSKFKISHSLSAYTPGEVLGRGNLVLERSSPRGQTPEPDREQTNYGGVGDTREYIPDQMSSTMQPHITISKSDPNYEQSQKVQRERMSMVTHESALFANMMKRLNSDENDSTMAEYESNSCHPDTWSEDQGEPGDSEPFCAPQYLVSKRCGPSSEP